MKKIIILYCLFASLISFAHNKTINSTNTTVIADGLDEVHNIKISKVATTSVLDAVDDIFSPVVSSSIPIFVGYVTGNDTLDGVPVTFGNTKVTPTTSGPLSITTNGALVLAPNTPSGVYTITYVLCQYDPITGLIIIPANCDVATVTVNVVNPPPAGCWKSVSLGDYNTLALKTDGTLWSWGSNIVGNLGTAATTDTNLPQQIGTDNDWKFITVGDYHSIGIKTNGTLWTWGWNQYYQLGLGNTNNLDIPTQVGTDTDWKTASALYGHTLALKNNNTLWSWGENTYGAVGNGNNIDQTIPVQISGNNWSAISAGDEHSIALDASGSIYCWGGNYSGQLGDGTTASTNSPIASGYTPNGSQWKSISGSDSKTFGVLNDGTLWMWGNGQNTPIQIGTDTDWDKINAGYFHYLALKTDGSLWSWGNNYNGQLGIGNTTDQVNPTQVGTDTDWTEIAAKYYNSAAIKSDGTLWVWGNNQHGEIGNGTNTDSAIPIQISCSTLSNQDVAKNNDIKIFPNPATTVLSITSKETILSTEITDINGRIILSSSQNKNEVILNIENFQSGMYLMKITSENGTSIQKIIKK